MIREFQGEYRFLSNFWPCQLAMGLESGRQITAPTLEHFYQAGKATDPAEFEWVLAASTPVPTGRVRTPTMRG